MTCSGIDLAKEARGEKPTELIDGATRHLGNVPTFIRTCRSAIATAIVLPWLSLAVAPIYEGTHGLSGEGRMAPPPYPFRWITL